MKFGKRLRREAHPSWLQHYVDYKALKRVIKHSNQLFEEKLHVELCKVNEFFCGKEKDLQDVLASVTITTDDGILKGYIQLCEDIDHLRKYVVLNYLAVRKILKKHDKKMGQPATTPVMQYLRNQPFYNSLTLAQMFTKAQCVGVLIKQARGETQFPKEDFLCPVCLDILSNPVVLSCAHRFCWTCLASAALFTSQKSACPVCRKEQSLDPRHYIVDSLLMAFIKDNFPNPSSHSQHQENSILPEVPAKESAAGFFYFFQQTHKIPTSLKILLVHTQLSTPSLTSNFTSHVRNLHPDANFCMMTSSPLFSSGADLSNEFAKFSMAPHCMTTLRHTTDSHKIPYVSSVEETEMGTLVLFSFRSHKSRRLSQMSTLEHVVKSSKYPLFLVSEYCSFSQLDNLVYPILLRQGAATVVKHMFLLNSAQESMGTWRNIPFSALTSSTAKSNGNVEYTQVVVKEDLVLVKPISAAGPVAFSPATQFEERGQGFDEANFAFVSRVFVVILLGLFVYFVAGKFRVN